MKILITTGIFAPESGGPATYAPSLAARLIEAGHQVTVLTYSAQAQYDFDARYTFRLVRVVRAGRLMSRVRFFFIALQCARECDLIYTLDWFAAGLPVMLAALIRNNKYIVRVGGDYLWEQKYLESGQEPVTLADFYARGLHRALRYALPLYIIRSVLSHAVRIIFNSEQERTLYEKYYGLDSKKSLTIYNPSLQVDGDIIRGDPTHEFVYWGRLIVMKNVESLIRAFSRARLPEDYRLAVIGDGPQKERLEAVIRELHLEEKVTISPGMPQQDAWQRIKDARAFILPSWTDISPNQVCEALAIDIPTLVTKENYLSFRDQLPEMFDPHSTDDLAAKLEMLADNARYDEFKKHCAAVSFTNSWDEVTRQHLELFLNL